MRIGELAKRTGLPASRIRFYERIGLLTAVGRHANGYRRYAADAAVILELIASAQKAGFSLDEIRTVMPTDLKQWDHGGLVRALHRKIADIEALEARLTLSRQSLVTIVSEIQAHPDDIDCASNARRLLGRLLGGSVPTAMSAADVRLLDHADRRQVVAPG